MDKGDSVGYDQVLNYIVGALRDTLGRVPREIRADVLEIRIRQGSHGYGVTT